MFGIFMLSCTLLCRQHVQTRMGAICDVGKATPIRGLFPILLQSELSQIFFPSRAQPMGVREDCAPAVQLDRQLSFICAVLLLSVL